MGNGKVSSQTRDPSQEKFHRISRKNPSRGQVFRWHGGYHCRIRGDRPKDSVYEMNLRKNPNFGEVYYVRSNPRSDSENSWHPQVASRPENQFHAGSVAH
jgi:hypothetical protein